MNGAIPLTEDIFWTGVNDRETDLFEAIWPLPHGISYNAYLIKDQKTTVIDTVKELYFDEFLDRIRRQIGDDTPIDYLIINHMEPDHSGSVKALADLYPQMKIVGNKKTAQFIEGFYQLPDERIQVVEKNETLDLGSHKLTFVPTPMVHWPESMVTYDQTSKILFSSDAFGGFRSLDGGIFDDELRIADYENEILRYFSNIIGKYGKPTQNAIRNLSDFDIRVVAPAHGPVWRSNPQRIIDLYDKWSGQQTEEGAVVVYGSMYGHTKRAAEEVARTLAEEGITRMVVHDISRTHPSFIITDIWRYSGLVIGSCTYNTMLFPPVKYLTDLLTNKGLKNHSLGIFGSYSWSGGALKGLKDFAEKSSLDLIEPSPEIRFTPGKEDYEACKQLGKNLAAAIKK